MRETPPRMNPPKKIADPSDAANDSDAAREALKEFSAAAESSGRDNEDPFRKTSTTQVGRVIVLIWLFFDSDSIFRFFASWKRRLEMNLRNSILSNRNLLM